MRRALVTCLLLASLGRAAADPVAVQAEGVGPSRDMAVSKALIAAVEQATGVTVDSSRVSAMTGTSMVSSNEAKTDIVEKTQEDIARQAHGRILSYNVTSVAPAPEGGMLARVTAQIEVFRAKASGTANRRRIAVAYFGADARLANLRQALHDRLLQYLTQSRRFAVLDRANDLIYAQEMAIVTGANAAPADRERAGKTLGTDYALTGHLTVTAAKAGGPATTQHVIELTGEVVTETNASAPRAMPGSIAADFEVIEITTRQIGYAGRIEVPGTNIDALAGEIVARITNAIYPPRLIDVSDPTELIVNQGGDGIRAGQRFRVMQEGREMFDPYTHESLGHREAQVAVIQIDQVTDKLSYGRLLSGAVSGSADSFLLRPDATPPPHPPRVARPIATARPAAPDTGLKLPFDH